MRTACIVVQRFNLAAERHERVTRALPGGGYKLEPLNGIVSRMFLEFCMVGPRHSAHGRLRATEGNTPGKRAAASGLTRCAPRSTAISVKTLRVRPATRRTPPSTISTAWHASSSERSPPSSMMPPTISAGRRRSPPGRRTLGADRRALVPRPADSRAMGRDAAGTLWQAQVQRATGMAASKRSGHAARAHALADALVAASSPPICAVCAADLCRAARISSGSDAAPMGIEAPLPDMHPSGRAEANAVGLFTRPVSRLQ